MSFYEQIEDPVVLQAVKLIDSGDVPALQALLHDHPGLVRQHVVFAGRNYFCNPGLLGFVAGNPIRHPRLPDNVVAVATTLLDAGAKQDWAAVNETLELVCSGKLSRECGQQIPLIALLCDYGANPDQAMLAALVHGEFEAVEALIRRGARVDLPVAAATGRSTEAARLLPQANDLQRQRALALASQFGHAEIVRFLLDAGQDPNRLNPTGTHSHSTPLHQAVLAGHREVVQLLLARGASLDLTDTLWNGTPLDWARHAQNAEMESYLVSRKAKA